MLRVVFFALFIGYAIGSLAEFLGKIGVIRRLDQSDTK
jgi:hypothetical protein